MFVYTKFCMWRNYTKDTIQIIILYLWYIILILFFSFSYLRAAAPTADPGRMVMWLYDNYIIYQMMVWGFFCQLVDNFQFLATLGT